jgi:lipopolysaccharide transport system permease protein
MVPERFQWLLALNPLSGLIEAFRYVVVPSHVLDWNLLMLSVGITGVLFVTSVVYFKSAEKAFADLA